MELKVYWTESAIDQLEDIFDYYKFKANTKVAKKLVTKITDRTIQLVKQPESGQLEELLKTRENKYRYIVEGNYKIIYWIEDKYIKIAAVFDTRQNPTNLNKL